MELTPANLKPTVKQIKAKKRYYQKKYIRQKKMLNMAIEALVEIQDNTFWFQTSNFTAEQTLRKISQYKQTPQKYQ